jgi:hypothetical protein
MCGEYAGLRAATQMGANEPKCYRIYVQERNERTQRRQFSTEECNLTKRTQCRELLVETDVLETG